MEKGNYIITGRFIDAWPGTGGYVAGYCVCEIREYEDGIYVHRSDPIYIHEQPEKKELHEIYLLASKALGV